MTTTSESRKVHWGDCSPSGAVFYPVYFRWFDEATWALFEVLDLPIQHLGSRYGVVGLPLISNNCEYRRPCRLGDQLVVSSSLLTFDTSHLTIEHRVLKDDIPAVVSREQRFWGVRHPADPARLRKGIIPAEVAAVFSLAATDKTTSADL